MILLSFVLAILSWRYIETPFRRKILFARRKNIFQFAAACLAASLTFGAAVFLFHGLPQRLPEAVRASFSANPQDDFLFVKQMRIDDIIAGDLTPFGVRDPSRPVSVVVWGDSFAMAALPAFDALLKGKGMSGRAATHSATLPVLGYFQEKPWGLGKDSLRYGEELVSYVEKNRIPHVILVACWSSCNSGSIGSLQKALLTTVKKLTSAGSQPWVFLQVPGSACDVGILLRRATHLDLNQRCFCKKPDTWNGIAGDSPAFLNQLTKAGARIIDPRPAFLNSNKDRYLNTVNGVALYRDRAHLTKLGAEKVLIPVLEKSFLPYLTAPSHTLAK